MKKTNHTINGSHALPEDELNKELKKYKALISASNTGAWEYNTTTEVLWGNDIYFSMLGRDIKDFDTSGKKNLANSWVNMLHPDDKANAITGFENYCKTPEGGYEAYFRMSHSDDSWVWIWSRGKYIGDGVIVGTHVNITQRKLAEEAMQQERILLRTLIDSLPDVIYIKDAEGRKVIANKADVLSIGKKSEAEVIGKTDLELFPNDMGKRGYEDDMRTIKGGEAILNKEEFFINDDGSKRWLVTSKVPVRDKSGAVSRLIGIGHDITVRKESEELLNKQATDLKLLNAELSRQKEQEVERAVAQGKFEIASEVLHDIGNALVGFGSHLNRISRNLEKNKVETIKNLGIFLKAQQTAIAGVLGEDKANALVTITEGIAREQGENRTEIDTSISELYNIISHIQEILNIQRQFVKGHGGVHERKSVNLVNIIDDCRSMLFASFDKHKINFKVNAQPGSYVIKGDHTKLMQVILNILKNSVEAMNFEAEGKQITLNLQSDDKIIELSLVDNGQGFDATVAEHLFERGYTTKKTGTGLGLYNCRSIVESHTGSFDIKSDGPGLGAVTTIRFAV